MHPTVTEAELEAIATEFALQEGDLDEEVEDRAHDRAADAFNNGARPELDFWDAHDAVHDDADQLASRINTAGVTAQLAYLTEGCTPDEVRARLRRTPARQPVPRDGNTTRELTGD
ncbi:hypothetical protein ACFYZ8_33355 [Streptomyces sp. NPDC001668]|uniref:hypothetical protein n=1 Tax=Streptomyces sp. NPDC001668 TaxID=3364598 RepID=UPI0036C771B7